MRNNFHQNRDRGHGGAWAGRNNQNNGPRRQASYPKPQRTVRAINLGRVAAEVERDVLACALEVTEQVLISLIEGSENANDSQYATHLSHRLEDMGFTMSWLDTPDVSISPAQVKTLKEFAAKSVTRKGPTRRSNFKKLVQAFNGRIGVLSDALELIETSVRSIADGRLEFDEQRFSHVNPRLMQAGFPNGWLESPDAELTSEMIDSLVSLATDDYERTLEEANSDDIAVVPAAHAVAPSPEAGESVASEMVAAPSTENTEVVSTEVSDVTDLLTSSAMPDAAEEVEAAPSIIEPSLVLEVLDTTSNNVSEVTPLAIEAENVMNVEPSLVGATPATPDVSSEGQEEKEHTMQTDINPSMPEQEATSTEVKPSVPSSMLPRGARDVGRAIIFQKEAPTVTVKQRKALELPETEGTDSLVGAPPPRFPGQAVLEVEPQAESVPAPQPKVFSAPRPVVVEPEVAAVAESVAATPSVAAKSDSLTREKSIQRAHNLDVLMADARRGAKVILWRDLLMKGLPFWNNVKRGAVFFKDDMVAKVENALGLPEGWIDSPTYPPATLAAWVMDKNASVPGLVTQPDGEAGEDDLKITPFAREPLPQATIELSAPTEAAPAVTQVSAPVEITPVQPAVPQTLVGMPAPQLNKANVEAEPVRTPELKVVSHPVVPSETGFVFSKPANPVPRNAPGPVAQAVVATLNELSVKGVFSEQDALRLLTHLMTEYSVG